MALKVKMDPIDQAYADREIRETPSLSSLARNEIMRREKRIAKGVAEHVEIPLAEREIILDVNFQPEISVGYKEGPYTHARWVWHLPYGEKRLRRLVERFSIQEELHAYHRYITRTLKLNMDKKSVKLAEDPVERTPVGAKGSPYEKLRMMRADLEKQKLKNADELKTIMNGIASIDVALKFITDQNQTEMDSETRVTKETGEPHHGV